MCRLFTYSVIILTISLLAGCSADNRVKPLKPLHVATGNWEPYVGQDLTDYGPMAKMVSAILADMGYTPEFKFYEWPMVEKHLFAGYPSIAFPYIKSESRIEKGFHFPEKYLHLFKYVLFYYTPNNITASTVTSLADLKSSNIKIGRIRGFAKLPGLPDDSAYTEVSSAVEGFNKLINNEIDYLLDGKLVGLNLLESQYINVDKELFRYLGQNIKEIDQEQSGLITSVKLYIMVSPKLDADVLSSLDSAISSNKNKTYFKSLRDTMTRPIQKQDTANLVSYNDEIIYGYSSSLGNVSVLIIPRNSKVLITEYGEIYKAQNSNKNIGPERSRSQVKLLNGPHRGRVMWVYNKHLKLE